MATDLANSWWELAQGNEHRGETYQRLAGLVGATLPNDTEAAAAVVIDGQPALVALAGDGLFVVTPEPSNGDLPPQPTVERIPLVPTRPALRIRDDWREDTSAQPLRGLGMQVREWTMTWPHGRTVAFESVVRRTGGFHDGPNDAEGLGRAVAGRLGWELPDAS